MGLVWDIVGRMSVDGNKKEGVSLAVSSLHIAVFICSFQWFGCSIQAPAAIHWQSDKRLTASLTCHSLVMQYCTCYCEFFHGTFGSTLNFVRCLILNYDMGVSQNTQQPWVFLLEVIILGCFGGTTILRKHPYNPFSTLSVYDLWPSPRSLKIWFRISCLSSCGCCPCTACADGSNQTRNSGCGERRFWRKNLPGLMKNHQIRRQLNATQLPRRTWK